MKSMSKQRYLSHAAMTAGFFIMAASAGAREIGTVKPGEPAERHLSADQTFREWAHGPDPADDTKRVKVCRVETVCKMRFKEGQTARTRVRNLVLPLQYEGESTAVSEDFARQIRQAMKNLQDQEN